MFALFVLVSWESCPLAFVFLWVALLIFYTSFAHSSLNQTTCWVKFLILCLSITFFHLLLVAILLLLKTVAYWLLARMFPGVLAARTLYLGRQEMDLQLSLAICIGYSLDLRGIELWLGLTLRSAWAIMGWLSMRGYPQKVARLKVKLLFPSLRFWWHWKMRNRGRLPVSLGIGISTSVRGLFLVPGVSVCNGSYGIQGICFVVVGKNAWICGDSIGDMVLGKDRIV